MKTLRHEFTTRNGLHTLVWNMVSRVNYLDIGFLSDCYKEWRISVDVSGDGGREAVNSYVRAALKSGGKIRIYEFDGTIHGLSKTESLAFFERHLLDVCRDFYHTGIEYVESIRGSNNVRNHIHVHGFSQLSQAERKHA